MSDKLGKAASGLTARELAALRVLRGYTVPFFGRHTTMRRLCAAGLTEPWPGHEAHKRPGYRLTDAGRQRVEAEP